MFVDGFIWLPGIVRKLQDKHSVWPDEVEEVPYGRPTIRRLERGQIAGEDLYGALGQTDSGRYLSVFFIYKPGNLAPVISARDMDGAERRRHGPR